MIVQDTAPLREKENTSGRVELLLSLPLAKIFVLLVE